MTQTNEASPQNDVSQSNPVMDKLLQRDANRTINDSLPEGVRAIFKKGLTDFILSEMSVENLVDLSKDQVLDMARDYAKREGLTTDDIYTQKGKPSAPKNSKPNTGSSRKAETRNRSRSSEDGGDDNKPKKPKNLSEFRKNRDNFLREIIGA